MLLLLSYNRKKKKDNKKRKNLIYIICIVVTVVSQFLVILHTAITHLITVLCAKHHWNSGATPPFQYFDHASDGNVQCGIRIRNCKMC